MSIEGTMIPMEKRTLKGDAIYSDGSFRPYKLKYTGTILIDGNPVKMYKYADTTICVSFEKDGPKPDVLYRVVSFAYRNGHIMTDGMVTDILICFGMNEVTPVDIIYGPTPSISQHRTRTEYFYQEVHAS